jgi:hypothetical protein
LYLALSPEERNMLLMMIPILRLADNLDRSREQRIQGVDCRLRDGGAVVLQVRAPAISTWSSGPPSAPAKPSSRSTTARSRW